MNSCLAAMAGVRLGAPSNLSLGCEVKSRHCEGATIKFTRFPAQGNPATGKLNTCLSCVGSVSIVTHDDGSNRSGGGRGSVPPQSVGPSSLHCELVMRRGRGFLPSSGGAVSASVNLSCSQSLTTSSPCLCYSSSSSLSSSPSPFVSSPSSLIAREGGHVPSAGLESCFLSPSTTSPCAHHHPRVAALVLPSPALSSSPLCPLPLAPTATLRATARCGASSSGGGEGGGGEGEGEVEGGARKEYRGGISGEGLRFGVVVGLFNDLITRPLLAGALGTFKRHGVVDGDVAVAYVPGSYEIPIVAQGMARSGKFDAILCIGAVIRGSTTHYDAVAGAAASGILNASLSTNVPCVFGVLTCETMEQAMDRAGGKLGNKGAETAATAVEMANLMKSLRSDGVVSS